MEMEMEVVGLESWREEHERVYINHFIHYID